MGRFISRQSWHFSFIVNLIEVLFPICTLIWRVNIYVSHQGKNVTNRNESTNFIFFRIVKINVLPCVLPLLSLKTISL